MGGGGVGGGGVGVGGEVGGGEGGGKGGGGEGDGDAQIDVCGVCGAHVGTKAHSRRAAGTTPTLAVPPSCAPETRRRETESK